MMATGEVIVIAARVRFHVLGLNYDMQIIRQYLVSSSYVCDDDHDNNKEKRSLQT